MEKEFWSTNSWTSQKIETNLHGQSIFIQNDE